MLIPYMLFNCVGESWLHIYFATGVELVLLFLIIRYAYKWAQLKNKKT